MNDNRFERCAIVFSAIWCASLGALGLRHYGSCALAHRPVPLPSPVLTWRLPTGDPNEKRVASDGFIQVQNPRPERLTARYVVRHLTATPPRELTFARMIPENAVEVPFDFDLVARSSHRTETVELELLPVEPCTVGPNPIARITFPAKPYRGRLLAVPQQLAEGDVDRAEVFLRLEGTSIPRDQPEFRIPITLGGDGVESGSYGSVTETGSFLVIKPGNSESERFVIERKKPLAGEDRRVSVAAGPHERVVIDPPSLVLSCKAGLKSPIQIKPVHTQIVEGALGRAGVVSFESPKLSGPVRIPYRIGGPGAARVRVDGGDPRNEGVVELTPASPRSSLIISAIDDRIPHDKTSLVCTFDLTGLTYSGPTEVPMTLVDDDTVPMPVTEFLPGDVTAKVVEGTPATITVAKVRGKILAAMEWKYSVATESTARIGEDFNITGLDRTTGSGVLKIAPGAEFVTLSIDTPADAQLEPPRKIVLKFDNPGFTSRIDVTIEDPIPSGGTTLVLISANDAFAGDRRTVLAKELNGLAVEAQKNRLVGQCVYLVHPPRGQAGSVWTAWSPETPYPLATADSFDAKSDLANELTATFRAMEEIKKTAAAATPMAVVLWCGLEAPKLASLPAGAPDASAQEMYFIWLGGQAGGLNRTQGEMERLFKPFGRPPSANVSEPISGLHYLTDDGRGLREFLQELMDLRRGGS